MATAVKKAGTTAAPKKAGTATPKRIQNKDKTYKLVNDASGVAFLLKTGRNKDLDIWDEVNNVRRQIRHCTGERSIFVDEQADNENIIVEPIIFELGYLTVRKNYPITQEFLDNHPSNGTLFECVDAEREAEDDIQIGELILDLKQEVRTVEKEKAGDVRLRALASVMESSVARVANMSVPELKRVIYAKIELNPRLYLDHKGESNLFSNSFNERKFIVLKSLNDGVLRVTQDNKLVWGDTSAVIMNIPRGINATTHLTGYLESEDGIILSEEIVKRS